MDKKQRFFIYDSKEVILLIILALGVAAFAFTLGVHLGKKVIPNRTDLSQKIEGDTKAVKEEASLEPSRFDLSENAAVEENVVVDEISKKLHAERERSGARLEVPMDTEIPEKTLREKKEELAVKNSAPAPLSPTALLEKASEKIQYPAPEGRFTLQVGSHPTLEEALAQFEKIKSQDLQPFIRTATVKNQKWYRVYLGGYPSSLNAQEFGTKMKEMDKIQSYLVSKMPE